MAGGISPRILVNIEIEEHQEYSFCSLFIKTV